MMTIVTKSLLALALTSFVAHARVLDPQNVVADETPLESFEPRVALNTANTFLDAGHPADLEFFRASPWLPLILILGNSYSLSVQPAPAQSDNIPGWMSPAYTAYLIGGNMFASETYWIAGVVLFLLLIFPRMQQAFFALRGDARRSCILCSSQLIRRVPVGSGLLGEARRALGQRAFRCNACNHKFFRRWDYEGSPAATRARAS